MEMVCRNGRMAGVNCGERPPSQEAGVGRGVGGRQGGQRRSLSKYPVSSDCVLGTCPRHLTELMLLKRQTILK